jgi:glutamine amidotransferase
MKVGIINYGMGNLGSVRRALEELQMSVVIAAHPSALADVNRIVLPGVGAFGEAMSRLRSGGWIEGLHREVLEAGKPLLGICLGMQLLATSSEEMGLHEGLNFIPGRVRRLNDLGSTLRVPHVGWNEVKFLVGAPLFHCIPQGTDFYFVHSYGFEPDDPGRVAATAMYGTRVTAAVQSDRIFGTQFHPEKSSRAGRQILKNFIDYPSC